MHIQARWFLPFWLVFQNLLPFFIGGFGVAGGGVAYLAHIGGFAVGLGYRLSCTGKHMVLNLCMALVMVTDLITNSMKE